ncbi:hypothetical protein [Kordiimonas sp. SCSIO 12610]|uniref:hypothetical protein n=1 Tax=Kordiimonas sp. SCSIO 12610 TaxID=2829597 RepID=UPI00210DF215|nr:hypothetical protein [Kordiimonas sp. SCSIO 12610]UTW56434.1 hypothetical protein KFF44_05890 [Kordiimonas sp. SCSIO 12610]
MQKTYNCIVLLCVLFMSTHAVLAEKYTCQSPVDMTSVINAIEDEKLIFIGELHGSNEMPVFLSALACHYAMAGERVLVALEMPVYQNDVLTDFVQAGNDVDAATAIDRLTTNEFWFQHGDGRQSKAMLGMINDLRQLSKGFQLDVVAVDLPQTEHDKSAISVTRDEFMAENIDGYIKTGIYDRILFFGGNNHTRLTKRQGVDKPIALHLKAMKPFSIVLSFKTGEVWACINSCGLNKLEYNKGNPAPENVFLERASDDFDGIVYFSKITASEPVFIKP